MSRSNCNLCYWKSQEWPTRDEAGCEASWHVYEEHPQAWRMLFGDEPPRDRDPRKGKRA